MAPMRLRRPTAAVLGLLALLPVLAACGDDDDSVKVGDIVDARRDDQFIEGGKASSVALPFGRLEISAGRPTTTLAADTTAQLLEVDAPEGSAFVPITWQYDVGTFGKYEEFVEAEGTPVIELLADRASYRLPAPESSGSGSDSFFVLVSGDGEDASLEIEYDGVTQTLDLATGDRDEGAAAGLYDLKSPKERTSSCADAADFDLSATERLQDFDCKVTTPVRLPYAGGAWADEGRSWLALTLSTTLRRYDRLSKDYQSGAIYAGTEVTSAFTLGGARPTKVIEDRTRTLCPDELRGGCVAVYHLIFDVADKATKKTGRLLVDQDYELTLVSVWGGGAGQDAIELSGKLSIKLP